MMARTVFILLALTWGSSFILMKQANLSFGPVAVAAFRVFGGGAALLIIWTMFRRDLRLERRFWPHVLLVAGIAYLIPFTLQPYLIARFDNSGFVGMMVAFVPLFTILISIAMLRILPSMLELVGVIGGLACVGVIFGDGVLREFAALNLSLAILVPLVYAFANTYIKRYLNEAPALPVVCCALLCAGSVLLAAAIMFESVKPGPYLARSVAAGLTLGVACTGLALFAFYWLIQKTGPLQAGLVTYCIPVVAMLWAWAAGEQITLLQVVALGGALAMVGVAQAGRKNVEQPIAEESAGAMEIAESAGHD